MASTIKVDTVTTPDGTGNITFNRPIVGDGSNLTNIITKSAAEPAADTNPSGGVGSIWLRTTTGEMYSCTDATAGSNVWTNIGDGTGRKPYTATVATGGTITTYGNFKVHTFSSSGTFTVTTLGTATTIDYLVVAGGGSGGYHYGGGGGAGGLVYKASNTITATSYEVVIGAGATEQLSLGTGNIGNDTTFAYSGTLTAKGGGGGGKETADASSGGSGGGSGHEAAGNGSGTQTSQAGDSGTYGFGNDGGQGIGATNYNTGGGGGAGSVGATGDATKSGNGGAGKDYSSIFSTSVGDSGWFASGGGGGPTSDGTTVAGTASSGGGTDGSPLSGPSLSGQANTGGGSGGGYNNQGARAGGSGVVIIRYQFQ